MSLLKTVEGDTVQDHEDHSKVLFVWCVLYTVCTGMHSEPASDLTCTLSVDSHICLVLQNICICSKLKLACWETLGNNKQTSFMPEL